jgi:ABC-type multidrug transport system fused ATPase/permease subunit
MLSKKFSLLRKVYTLFRPFRATFATGFLFVAVDQLFSLAPAYIQSVLIDGLITRSSLDTVLWAIGGLVGIAFLHRLLGYCQYRFQIAHLNYAVPKFLQRHTLKQFFLFSIGQHRIEHSGAAQDVMSRGEHSLDSFVRGIFYNILPQILTAVFSVAFLSVLSPLFGLITVVGMTIFVVAVFTINHRFREQMFQQQELWREYSRIRSEALRNADTVIVNAQEHRAISECDDTLLVAQTHHKQLWISYEHWSLAIRDWVPIITRGALMFLGAAMVWSGEMTPGALVMLWSWSNQALSSTREFSRAQRQLVEAAAAIRKYFEMLGKELKVPIPNDPQFPKQFKGAITFQNVTMRHSARVRDDEEDVAERKPTLENITFSIAAGETVAIVGESGAGKTTVIELVLRAYDPDNGSVSVDGVDLRDINLARLRRSIGIVEQHVPLFDNTLRYNMTYGLSADGVQVSDALLDRVARAARIDHFFPKLEKGYDTVIGERGIKLSGGERQRVGIARALLKDPKILIFDEATSSLDARNEALIQESIEHASRGRTTIIIAHRFSTIRKAHRVIVLSNGHVVGDGAPDVLERTCTVYRELLNHQVIV